MAFAAPLIAAKADSHESSVMRMSTLQYVESFTRKSDIVIGDYAPLNIERFFEPASACIVDKDIDISKKIAQCKKQRVGWMKI